MGLFATGMGIFIILMSVDIIHADPESIHAPRWVLTLAGIMFTSIGLYTFSTGLLSPNEQKLPIIQWIQYFLILGMLTAFAAIFLWIGFGPGEREFSSSGSIGFLTVSGKGNDILGRIMFGGGGLLAALMAGYYAFTGARNIVAGTSDRDSSWD
jgi:hypothetical protein